jgi:hypothetical protein
MEERQLLPLTSVIWTNFKRWVVVVKIKWTGVTRKEVQFFTNKREFAYRWPFRDMPKAI